MAVRARAPHERALSKIDRPDGPDGCWLWTGTRNRQGYGRIGAAVSPGRTRLLAAHRVMYEAHVGPIPDGLELDHAVCQNPSCVNPAHLEPVTHAENMRRARLLRTSCRAGHQNPERDRWGDCVQCRQKRERRRVRRTRPEGATR